MVAGEVSTRPQINNDVEFIALFPRPTCPKPQKFPIIATLSLYGMSIEFLPLLCGFNETQSSCYSYSFDETRWKHRQFGLIKERTHASSASLENSSWIIIGGQTYMEGAPVLLNDSEIFSNDLFVSGPGLPIPLSGHCTVKLNDGQIATVGGYGSENHLKDAFMLNLDQKPYYWSTLNSMETGRFGHACGKVQTFFYDIEIIAAGGLHQEKVEIYSIARETWLNGPRIEDRQMFKTATVQGEITFLLTGGIELEPDCTTNNCRLDGIHVYDAGTNLFNEMEQKLAQGRGNHMSVALNTDVDCSGKSKSSHKSYLLTKCLFQFVEKMVLFVTGSSLSDIPHTPEIVGIGLAQVNSKYAYLQRDFITYNNVWEISHIGMVGTFLGQEIFICGGLVNENGELKSTDRCQTFSLLSYEWQESNISMIDSRAFAKSVLFPNGTFVVIGGQGHGNIILNTIEYLDGSMTFSNGPEIPERFSHHCAALINGTHLFISGGLQNIPSARGKRETNNKALRVAQMFCACFAAFILQTPPVRWEYLASMNEARYDHACGIVGQKEILVAGGTNVIEQLLDSVEILSLENLEWRDGKPLPERISGAFSLEYESSFLVIGGHGSKGNGSNIYQYVRSQHAWAKREETLATKRASHIAIAIEGIFLKNETLARWTLSTMFSYSPVTRF